jgi:hypothetical protein
MPVPHAGFMEKLQHVAQVRQQKILFEDTVVTDVHLFV